MNDLCFDWVKSQMKETALVSFKLLFDISFVLLRWFCTFHLMKKPNLQRFKLTIEIIISRRYCHCRLLFGQTKYFFVFCFFLPSLFLITFLTTFLFIIIIFVFFYIEFIQFDRKRCTQNIRCNESICMRKYLCVYDWFVSFSFERQNDTLCPVYVYMCYSFLFFFFYDLLLFLFYVRFVSLFYFCFYSLSFNM